MRDHEKDRWPDHNALELIFYSTLFFLPLAFVHDPVYHFLPPTFACQQLQMWTPQQQPPTALRVHHRNQSWTVIQ
jgi:hypothetical protein